MQHRRERSQRRPWPGRHLVVLAMGVALLAGCGAENPEQSTDASEDLAQQLLNSTTEEQRDVLGDLEVSEAEYIDVYDELRACLRQRGWDQASVERHANGISFMVGVDAPDSQLDGFETDLAECRHTFVADVEQVFFAQQVAPEADFPRLKEELVDCLAQQGVNGVSTDMTDGQIANLLYEQNAPVAAWVCRETFLFKIGEADAPRSDGAGG